MPTLRPTALLAATVHGASGVVRGSLQLAAGALGLVRDRLGDSAKTPMPPPPPGPAPRADVPTPKADPVVKAAPAKPKPKARAKSKPKSVAKAKAKAKPSAPAASDGQPVQAPPGEPAPGFPEPPGKDPGDISKDREPHHALNSPVVDDPDPTEWPDPYEHREDPRDPPDPDERPFGAEPHPPTGSTSTSEPHPSQDPEAGDLLESVKRDKLDD